MLKLHSISKEFAEMAKKRLGKRLISLILYGSVAKGKASRDSDIDIFAVVTDKVAKEELFGLAFEFDMKYGIIISTIIRTPKDVEKMKKSGSLYLKEIRETGKVLYGKNAS